MAQERTLSRRSFVKAAATGASLAAVTSSVRLTAAQQSRVMGANERIHIGQIGCGSRGIGAHMKSIQPHLKTLNADFVAVCDPWRVAREAANAKVKEWCGHEAVMTPSYQELLAVKDLDAVCIASCDHQHTAHLEAAAKAGKHIYVEKPMAMHMDKLIRAVDAVKAAGVCVQVGTNMRSVPFNVGTREFFQKGLLGKPSRLEQCRNSERPYWYGYVKPVKKEDVDWKEFLMDAPQREFDPVRYSGWYGYRDYSDGPIPGLGSHFVDLMHFITGATFPSSCVCLGGTYTWKDQNKFDCPDHVEALWTYPEGFMMAYSTDFGNGSGSRIRMGCEKGTINMDGVWSEATVTPLGGPKRDGKVRGEQKIKAVECPDHWQDWLQCIRSGKQPVASIDAGLQHAVAVIMAMMAFDTGKRMIYDPAKREVREG